MRVVGLLVAAVVLQIAVAQGAGTMPFRIAVLPYQLSGASAADDGRGGWGVELAGEVEAALGQSGRFITVDRRRIDEILGEQVLSVEGLTDEQVRELGNLLGATLFAEGTIAVNPGRPLRVTTRIIRVASGQVISLPQDVGGPESFPDAARRVVEWAMERFPLEGRVVAIDAEGAFIDLGSSQGLTARDAGGEIVRERQIAGLDASDRIGSFRVVRILPGVTLIEASLEDGFELRVGDLVRFVPSALASAPATPPAVATGTLLVRGAPVGAVVLVDGVEIGVAGAAGWARPLPVGSVSVEVRAEGFEPFAERAEIVAERVAEVFAELVPAVSEVASGSLQLEVDAPTYQVTIDGRPYGQVGEVTLPSGTYNVRVDASGRQSHHQDVVVVAGQARSVRFSLSPTVMSGTATFTSTPAGAEVYVEGRYVGETNTGRIALDVGSYEAEFRRNGYQVERVRIEVRVNADTRVLATLQALTGTLEIQANVGGARVFIDGREFGVIPSGTGRLTVRDLEEGDFQIVLIAPGYEPATQESRVWAGESRSVTLRLVRRQALASGSAGTLEILANVGGARVFIDGREFGVIPSGTGRLTVRDLEEGVHGILLIAPGYLVTIVQARIQTGQTTPITLRLVRP